MKLLKSSLITAAVTGAVIAVSAVPAFAHAGPHNASLGANIMHWLTSPTHALFAVIGSAVIVALINRLNRSQS